VDLLLRQLEGTAERDIRSVVPVELVVRGSTGPAPRGRCGSGGEPAGLHRDGA
jgi:hypothetical protein